MWPKPIASIIPKNEKLKGLAIRQGCLLSLVLYNIVLEVLVTAIREEKEIKGIQMQKEVKLTVRKWYDIIIENPINTTKKLLEIMNLVKPQDIKLIHINPLHFYIQKWKIRKEIREVIPFITTTTMNKMPRNKPT